MVVTHHRARYGLPSGVLESSTVRWRGKSSVDSNWLVYLAVEASTKATAGSSWIRRQLGARRWAWKSSRQLALLVYVATMTNSSSQRRSGNRRPRSRRVVAESAVDSGAPQVEFDPSSSQKLEGVQFRFRTRYGQYLRANGKFPPWRDHIKHEVPYLFVTQDWILWTVEILEERQQEDLPRLLPPPPVETSSPHHIESNSDSNFSLRGLRESTLEADESTEGSGWAFDGRKALKEEAKVDEEFTICSRNSFSVKLYAFPVDLPPNNSAMHVVVVPQSSKGYQFVIMEN
ncbi:hypothetical protein F3Y22_tig00112399pilonHSYRG00040 [Hibiscus syriacus]|uniref:DUF569 domain-containing protein n=1 Tax=Hibiscus syriacus TaxID=106335 RepID=A0A6A2WZE8_HIBSY|nr:hypothetical protein F3Y22_tig00112399pilonHSYRG00040 [Hibiscus syriacus]